MNQLIIFIMAQLIKITKLIQTHYNHQSLKLAYILLYMYILYYIGTYHIYNYSKII